MAFLRLICVKNLFLYLKKNIYIVYIVCQYSLQALHSIGVAANSLKLLPRDYKNFYIYRMINTLEKHLIAEDGV